MSTLNANPRDSLQRLVSRCELERVVARTQSPVRSGVGGVLKHMPQATHLDLFSGIGGFAIAARAAGFRTIAFSEIEPYACQILKRHWKTVPNLGDIRSVRGVRANLVTGGFPCQPWSACGPQYGKEDARNLWPEMCRVVSESGATWFVGENVPSIDGMVLDEILDDLEGIGYEVAPPLEIPAGAAGAYHKRARLWVVAYSASNAGKLQSGEGENLRDEPAINGAAGTALESPWRLEPVLAGTADGLPGKSHRYRALGNAIVPDVAFQILRGIAAINAGGGGAEQVGDADARTNSRASTANSDSTTTRSITNRETTP